MKYNDTVELGIGFDDLEVPSKPCNSVISLKSAQAHKELVKVSDGSSLYTPMGV